MITLTKYNSSVFLEQPVQQVSTNYEMWAGIRIVDFRIPVTKDIKGAGRTSGGKIGLIILSLLV